MSKVSKEQIESFLAPRRLAIAGVSRNPKKFGYQVMKELSDKGYSKLPVNPNADEIYGIRCYKRVSELPDDVDSLLIITPKPETDAVLEGALRNGLKNIWVHQTSDTADTLKIAEEYQKEIIYGKCIFMFAEPVVSVHKFHRALVKFFGGLPKSAVN